MELKIGPLSALYDARLHLARWQKSVKFHPSVGAHFLSVHIIYRNGKFDPFSGSIFRVKYSSEPSMILYKPVEQMTGCVGVHVCVCLREVFVNTHPCKEGCMQAGTPFSLLSPVCLPP